MLKRFVVTAKNENGVYSFIVIAKNLREAADVAENELTVIAEDEIVTIRQI